MIADDLQHLTRPISDLTVWDKNYRQGDVGAVSLSLERFGQCKPIVGRHYGGELRVIAGNHTLLAASALGWDDLAVVVRDDLTEDEALAYAIADNRTSDLATNDLDMLAEHLASIAHDEQLLLATGYDGNDVDNIILNDQLPTTTWDSPLNLETTQPASLKLADRFLVPPFSILDQRQGYWRDRKQFWLGLGLASHEGRPGNLLSMSDTVLRISSAGGSPSLSQSMPWDISANAPGFFYEKQRLEGLVGRDLTSNDVLDMMAVGEIVTASGKTIPYEPPDLWAGAGTSIFDPVLTELAYKWWCPPGGHILDPFAGGSVRGVVAARLGYRYDGCDLRSEQIAANEQQLHDIATSDEEAGRCRWHVGDSTKPDTWSLVDGPADMVFTCPPYFDLEQYSDDPQDLSNKTYDEFLHLLGDALGNADARLADNRFAVIVMGEVRDEAGLLRGLIPDTVAAAASIGWQFYNDAILVSPVGSAAVRAARIFNGGRKLTRVHQYVLVFVKGDWQRAHEQCGSADVATIEELLG